MKIRYSFLCLAAFFVFLSCQDNQRKDEASVRLKGSESVDTLPHAQISVPLEVDMGTFQGSEMEKTVDIKVENVGGEPLYIDYLSPECDCTAVSVVDSVVAPGAATLVHATLDLSGYPADTIRKRFSIISNSRKDHVVTITLKGEVK